MSDARAAAGPQTMTMAAPLRRAGGDGGTTRAAAPGENEGAQ
ncbi:hypothetical protein [Streptomyces abyssalis]|nr:hypothetical protein [Streptomyces abyssalis]